MHSGIHPLEKIEAAKLGHDSKWCVRIAEVFDCGSEFDYFEFPVVIDNAVK
jgi:hypothetical protein